MRTGVWRAAVVGALLVLPAAPALAAPLEAYGKLPSIEQAALSPDGSLIAVALTDGEARSITVIRARDKNPVVTLKAGDTKVRSLIWAGQGHLLITSSVTTSLPDLLAPMVGEWFSVFDYNLKTGALRNVLDGAGETLTAADSDPEVRIIGGQPFAFVNADYFVSGEGRISLFKVDLDHNKTTLASLGWRNTGAWVTSADGEALAESEFDTRTGHWLLKVRRGNDWSQAYATDDDDSLGWIGLARDGRAVMMSGAGDDRDDFRDFDSNTQKWAEPFATMAHGVPIDDPDTGALIGLDALNGDKTEYRFFAPADQAAWNAVVRAFPGQAVGLASLSADHRKWLVRVDSPIDGPAYAFIDLDAHKAYFVGTTYDDLKAEDVSPVRPVVFKAADGLALSGYLTLPKGRDPKNLPLIVFPHGGPAARDEPGFDWWAQAMASRGYAVLQVNYRGSSGYGWDFLKAGFGEWGRKMQTDLSDGVRYLASQGTIDPKRVCIVGASYGGYAALAGRSRRPTM
jgi:dipeptidyl aminopeptidase/acylaminoacyl peptidase